MVTSPFLTHFSTKHWEICPNLGNDGSNTPSMLPKTGVWGISPTDSRKRASKGLLHTPAQFAGSTGMQMMQEPLQRGNCIPWAQRSQGCTPFHSRASADSQRVPEQPQFSPFTPVLLHLTGRTTGSDTDEFAKSKENNWIQHQNKGWVFRG